VAQARRAFLPELDSIPAARHFARDTLKDWGMPPDDVVLVVCELATNALLHARSDFEVALTLDSSGNTVLVEVTDPSSDTPRLVPAPFATNRGRGLMIVDRLCRSWGSRLTCEGGKTVWAELEKSPLSSSPRPAS
jgi:two-component sensor histidine kinase